MTCFRGAKVCTKWLQGKVAIKSYSLTKSWNLERITSLNWDQDEIGTKSGKLRIGHECVVTMPDADTNDNMFTIVHDCVVTLHDANTTDDMTTFTDFHICLSVSAHCSVSSCVLARHISRTRTVAQVMSLSSHPHVHVHVSVSPRFALLLLLHALPAAHPSISSCT